MDFLPFAKNMGKIIGKNISKGLNGKNSQKLLDHAEQSATDALRKVIQKTTEANKIANKTTKVSRSPKQNN